MHIISSDYCVVLDSIFHSFSDNAIRTGQVVQWGIALADEHPRLS